MTVKYAHNTQQYIKQIRPKKGLKKQLTFLYVKSNPIKKGTKGKTKLAIGIQMLKKGDEYGEPRHRNGEVYFVLKGQAKLSIGKQVVKASPGTALLVPAGKPHRFYDVKEEFVFLFIFAGVDV